MYVLDTLFAQPLSRSSLVYLLAWHPPLHTPYISSANHCFFFATQAHTIATCFAVIPRLCPHVNVVRLMREMEKQVMTTKLDNASLSQGYTQTDSPRGSIRPRVKSDMSDCLVLSNYRLVGCQVDAGDGEASGDNEGRRPRVPVADRTFDCTASE